MEQLESKEVESFKDQLQEIIKPIESKEIESFKEQLKEIIKPYKQVQNRRQKKIDFLAKSIQSIEKSDFFLLDELLRSKLTNDVMEDSNFESCGSIFKQLRKFAENQVDKDLVKFKDTLLELAKEIDLPLVVNFPFFSVLKGIEGQLNFSNRSITINQITIKSMDPKRIISAAVKLKSKLYDASFEPQKFIDSLLHCYKEILKKEGRGENDVVPIYQLYTGYVWSLQSKAFFQNMDKGKFKGYTIEQFAVNLWRFFESNVSTAEGGYQIRLNSGRAKSMWLIDQKGEKRQITHAMFIKN